MTIDRIPAAGEFLFNLRNQPSVIAGLPAELVPQTPAEGYAVQDHLVCRLLDKNSGKPIGYKIACTSVMAQKALAVDGPFFGILMSHSTHTSGAKLKASDFTIRCIESEFGFEMAADVPSGPEYTAETIREFIGSALPGIEIVDHRFEDWKTVGANSLLADNAIHGAWVVGEPYAGWKDLDFATHPVMLTVNGSETYPGSGAAVLGNPLNVVAWLANTLPEYGRKLKQGDRITTGVTTDIYYAKPGDRLVADFGVMGRAELNFN
jgi:2-keto-4-pentenoate hydratase